MAAVGGKFTILGSKLEVLLDARGVVDAEGDEIDRNATTRLQPKRSQHW
jgi:hypothetical protein